MGAGSFRPGFLELLGGSKRTALQIPPAEEAALDPLGEGEEDQCERHDQRDQGDRQGGVVRALGKLDVEAIG